MKNYPFNFESLFHFSNSNPYLEFTPAQMNLKKSLEDLQSELNFPAINDDIGAFISFLLNLSSPKRIFEMGSGYGHSAFWYQFLNQDILESIYLTERREDLQDHFLQLKWDKYYFEKMQYFCGDAFECIKKLNNIDFLLIDGQKSDYQKFLEVGYNHLNENALILIDNSYWRGSFLDDEYLHHDSASKIKSLHQYLKNNLQYAACFIPFKDGVSLLRKLPS